jgi:hypothetical protein
MPYLGKLKKNTTVAIEITNSSADVCATTTLLINGRDRITDASPNSVAAGAMATISASISDRIDRVLLLVSPPPGGRAVVRVNQGTAINVDADAQLTFDTE